MSLIEIEQLESAYEIDKKRCENAMSLFEKYMIE
jgi:hypothetical protein